MKNVFVLLVALLVLAPFASAEIKHFSHNVTLKVDKNNETCTVSLVDLDDDATMYMGNCNTDLNEMVVFSIYRDVNLSQSENAQTIIGLKEIITNMSDSITVLSSSQNDSQKYYDLYTTCFSERQTCNDDVDDYKQAADLYAIEKDKRMACENIDLLQCRQEKSDKENAYELCLNQKSSVSEERDKARSERLLYALVALVAGVAGAYWYWVKRKDKESETEKGGQTLEVPR